MKFLKWLLLIIAVLVLAFFLGGKSYLIKQTKKHSPERTATYNENGMDIIVNYSSPYKKDRVIFGDLVPYGIVWRTGANEPTTFTTATKVTIEGKDLAAGTYSLWTIPNESSWEIIFNSEVPDWGVTILSGGKETTREPLWDVVKVTAPVTKLKAPIERFTIQFDQGDSVYLSLLWDQTKVSLPIHH
ncbi:DUF2911 domain-containing protein [Arenibacter latericius]|uniref:DUF2911 domain-containing protein n=1 Tax=Arenibacter latericius TaxID=86104 RepID=UPI00041E0D82|nr:DUF2911 domain-containing protein [Arenibacter latericius]MDX1365327.1 DUF2911 domain-containing protein [Arenibacter latericius]